MSTALLCLDLFLVLTAFLILRRLFYGTKTFSAPLPPGPAGLPLIGNLLDMPSDSDWLTFAKWGELYG